MTKSKQQRGGARPGAGRKREGEELLAETLVVRLSVAQKAKALALGGGAWIRTRIDRAKDPQR